MGAAFGSPHCVWEGGRYVGSLRGRFYDLHIHQRVAAGEGFVYGGHMKRAERRRLERDLKREPIHLSTAIHEAGHAVARYLTASEMGIDPDNSIWSIRVTPRIVGERNGRALVSMACVEGPMFSQQFMDVIRPNLDASTASPDANNLAECLARARTDGMDMSDWVRARSVYTLMGPIIEAVTTKRPFEAVLMPNDSDIESIRLDCHLAGVPTLFDEILDVGKRRCYELLERLEIHHAIIVLANELVRLGDLTGKRAITVIRGALTANVVQGAPNQLCSHRGQAD
jgi:hypothetical protein